MPYLNTYQNLFDHSPSTIPTGTILVISDITKFIVKVNLSLQAGEVSMSGLRFVVRYGTYSWEGGQETPIAATFDFPYTGGDKIIDLGIVPSSWGYYNADRADNIITVSMSVRVTNGIGTYYDEKVISEPKINYYNGPSPERFNASRDLTTDTTALFDLKLIATSIKMRGGTTEYNSLQYKRQYHNGTSWVDIEAYQPVTGLLYENILSHTLPYQADLSYNVRIALKDVVQELFYSDLLSTAAVPLSLGKTGIGVGKIHEQGVLDIFGDVFKNAIKQPTIFRKKETDPDPDTMEDGDILIIYNDVEAFSSATFPQSFGTGFVWGQVGTWPTPYYYWTSMQSTSNTIIESFEVSSFKGNNYPSAMFDGDTVYSNGFFIPIEASPVTVMLKFKGSIQFNSFNLLGWGQDHETGNSPKSMAIFGSNDGHTWDSLYDSTLMPNSWKTTITQTMINTGNYYEYMKIVFRTNQDDNAGTNGSMIAIGELSFDCSGYKYV